MKKVLLIFSFLIFATGISIAQNFESPVIAFNQAANDYVFEGENKAINTLNRALKEYPDDEKLRALLEKILEDRKQKQEQRQQQQNQKEQQKQEQQFENQKQEDQQKDQQQKQDQSGQKDQEKKDQQQQQQEKGEQANEDKNAEEKEGQAAGQQQEKPDEDQKDQESIPQIRPGDMEDLNISAEKARMILEAMKNNEIQYLQQMQRKPTERPDSDKPDW